MCQSELAEFFAELTEFAPELSEFSSPKQYSRNSIPLPFPGKGPLAKGLLPERGSYQKWTLTEINSSGIVFGALAGTSGMSPWALIRTEENRVHAKGVVLCERTCFSRGGKP